MVLCKRANITEWWKIQIGSYNLKSPTYTQFFHRNVCNYFEPGFCAAIELHWRRTLVQNNFIERVNSLHNAEKVQVSDL